MKLKEIENVTFTRGNDMKDLVRIIIFLVYVLALFGFKKVVLKHKKTEL